MNLPTKKQKRLKLLYNIGYFLFMLALSAAWARFIPLDGMLSIFGLLATTVGFISLSIALEKRLFPKPVDENTHKEPKLPLRIIGIAVSAGAGFFTVLGLIGIGYALWFGEPILGENLVFVGFLVAGVFLLLATVFMPAAVDPAMKEMRQEMKYYGKDERMQLITYKTGFYTLAVLLLAILTFGAVISVFPPESPNAIPLGILGLFLFGALTYIGIFAYYDSGTNEGKEPNEVRSSIFWLFLTLIPTCLMGLWWLINGLYQIDIVFFVVFVLQTIYCLVNLIIALRAPK